MDHNSRGDGEVHASQSNWKIHSSEERSQTDRGGYQPMNLPNETAQKKLDSNGPQNEGDEALSKTIPDKDSTKEADVNSDYEVLIDKLTDEYGEPETRNKDGKIVSLQEPFFAALLQNQFERVLFEPSENRFYFYDSTDGLFKNVSLNALKAHARQMLLTLQKAHPDRTWRHIHNLSTNTFQNSLTQVLKGMIEFPEGFKRQYGLIHTANCMLVYNEFTEKFDKCDFAQDYMSRNASVFNYEPTADCPEFKKRILGHILPEDRDLIQEYAGQCLLGDNISQTILLLIGVGGSSKGALVRIIKGVVGERNVRELRTQHVDGRFEIAMYVGKSLLIGSDVKSDFLVDKVKSLCGSDTLEAETKGSSIQKTIEGRFNIFATSNEDMTVDLDGDSSAWERRLRAVYYETPFEGDKIPDIEIKLLQSEGSGILNWCVAGAEKLLKRRGDLIRTELQTKRITDLLQSSESLRLFLGKSIVQCYGSGLTTEAIVQGYADYCKEQGWSMTKDVVGKLPDLMIELFQFMLDSFCH